MPIYMYVCICVYVYAYVCICMYVYARVFVYVCTVSINEHVKCGLSRYL